MYGLVHGTQYGLCVKYPGGEGEKPPPRDQYQWSQLANDQRACTQHNPSPPYDYSTETYTLS